MGTVLEPAEAFPAGEYLRGELEERGWTVTEFAGILARPVQVVSEILNGKKELTTETAVAIADALGTTPELWLNLQTSYRLYEQRKRRSSVRRRPRSLVERVCAACSHSPKLVSAGGCRTPTIWTCSNVK